MALTNTEIRKAKAKDMAYYKCVIRHSPRGAYTDAKPRM